MARCGQCGGAGGKNITIINEKGRPEKYWVTCPGCSGRGTA